MGLKTILFPLLLLLILASCKKDTIDKPPAEKEITACINGPAEVETPKGNTYTWCGENATEIEWRLNGGAVLATGSSFTPTFTTRGRQIITATGKGETASKEAAIEVFYGKNVKIVCKIDMLIAPQGDKKKYWAYLYNSKTDWATDAVNGSHKLVIDSVNCRDTIGPGATTHYAFFKNVYAAGSTKLVSVEYHDASKPRFMESNWHSLYTNGPGMVTIQNIDRTRYKCFPSGFQLLQGR